MRALGRHVKFYWFCSTGLLWTSVILWHWTASSFQCRMYHTTFAVRCTSIRRLRPHVRHPKPAQRTSGSDFGHFDSIERPVSGKHAAPPRQIPRFGRRALVDFSASASGSFVRGAVIGEIWLNGCLEPNSEVRRFRISRMQQQNQLRPSAALRQAKRPFVEGAAKSGEPMSQMRDKTDFGCIDLDWLAMA